MVVNAKEITADYFTHKFLKKKKRKEKQEVKVPAKTIQQLR